MTLLELSLATAAISEMVLKLVELFVEGVPPVLIWALHITVGVVLALFAGAGIVSGLAAAGGATIVTSIMSALSRYPAVLTPPFRR